MAKAKAESKKDETPAYLKDIIKKHGNIIKTGTQLLAQRKDYKIVSIGPSIDLGLNGGIREGSWIIFSGAAKSGKAQPYSAVVHTPDGPKLMGDIKQGDVVCVPNGTANVVGVYPQGTLPVYKITFNDGSSTRASSDHLWKVRKNRSGSEWVIKTTEELEIDLKLQDRNKWVVPVGAALYNTREVKLPPELLGCLLADGSLNGKEIRISTKVVPDDIVSQVSSFGCFLSPYSSLQTVKKGVPNEIVDAIQAYGLKVTRKDKFIPDDYKYGDVTVRSKLLHTMLDLNGHRHLNGYIEYTTCSNRLAQDMADVGRSLGYYVKISKNKGSNRLIFSSLKTRKIDSIVLDGEEQCKCIKVDSFDKLYLTDNYVPTHNTTTAMQLAYNCQLEGRPVIYVNSECRLSELNFEIPGLDPEKLLIITAEDHPLSAEVFLDTVLSLISLKEYEGALCIIDSISSLIPQKDLESEVSGTTRPGLPKLLSDFTKKAGQIVPNNKIIMCLITHLITNTSGYGATRMADGGVKIQFQSDTRMEVKSIVPWEQSGKQIGQAVNWKIYWSGLGATGAECQSWLRYGQGIDRVQELFIMAQEAGLISKSGKWMKLEYLAGYPETLLKLDPTLDVNDPEKVLKFLTYDGAEAAYNFLNTTSEAMDILNQEIKAMLG